MMVRAETAGDPHFGAEIVTCARAWIGTPYQRQASCRGAGTDCLGLLRGVWRELFVEEPEAVPPYTTDWSESNGIERLLQAAERHMAPVRMDAARPGDVLVFRLRDERVAKHLGILARSPEGYSTVVHAYSGQGVVESALTPAWIRRIAGVFRIPDRR